MNVPEPPVPVVLCFAGLDPIGRAGATTPEEAVTEAQRFTHEAISNGYRIGAGQLVPDRLHRARGHGVSARGAVSR